MVRQVQTRRDHCKIPYDIARRSNYFTTDCLDYWRSSSDRRTLTGTGPLPYCNFSFTYFCQSSFVKEEEIEGSMTPSSKTVGETWIPFCRLYLIVAFRSLLTAVPPFDAPGLTEILGSRSEECTEISRRALTNQEQHPDQDPLPHVQTWQVVPWSRQVIPFGNLVSKLKRLHRTYSP